MCVKDRPLALLFSTLCLCWSSVGMANPSEAEKPREWTDSATGLSFVWIAPGCFEMGAEAAKAADQDGAPRSPRADETPRHRVCLDGYWMGRHEVTRGQWHGVMGSGSQPAGDTPRYPMVRVTWQQAQQFVERLNTRQAAGRRFRLPTEAEWEYACQPGEPQHDIDENRWEREDELKASAWFRGNKRSATDASAVGTLAANPRGLFDMLGNVWEWTADTYQPQAYRLHTPNNPQVNHPEARKVMRGGSFRSDLHQARCGARNFGLIDDALPTVGVRLVMEEGKTK